MRGLCTLKEVFKLIYVFEEQLKNEFDLSINETLTLCALSGENKEVKCSGVMADEIGISVSRMSRVFSSLEDKSLIVRKIGKDDKRKMVFTLSEKGKKKLEKMNNSNIKVPEIFLAGKETIPQEQKQ